MGLVLQKNLGAGAPEIEDAIYDAIFNGVTPESHPDWAGPNKFGGQDDGERWRFAFTPVENGAFLYNPDGTAIEVDVLTNQTMGKKSNAYAIMSGILTKTERDAVDAGEPIDSDALVGRLVQVVIEHNDSGWPKVASVIPARKGTKAPAADKPSKAAAAQPPVEASDAADEDDEETALLAQIEAARAKKASATVGEDPAAAAKAERIAAAKAALAALEEED